MEAAAYWTAGSGGVRWEARAVGYYNRVDDLIVFQCDADFNCLPRNVARATLKGVTLGLDLAWRDTRVKASVDLQDPEDNDYDRRLHALVSMELWYRRFMDGSSLEHIDSDRSLSESSP